MVNEVHVRRHDDPPEEEVRPFGDPEVSVVEHGHAVEKHFKDQDGQGGRSEEGNRGHFDQQRDNDFQRVKTEPMKQHVLGVDQQIEHQDGDKDGSRFRERKDVQKPPSFLRPQEGHTDGEDRKKKAREEAVHQMDRNISEPAHGLLHSRQTTGNDHFRDRDDGEEDQGAAGPDDGFMPE